MATPQELKFETYIYYIVLVGGGGGEFELAIGQLEQPNEACG